MLYCLPPFLINCSLFNFLFQFLFKSILWSGTNKIIVRAKKQPWASSLCHSRVTHTDVVLSLRNKKPGSIKQRHDAKEKKISGKFRD